MNQIEAFARSPHFRCLVAIELFVAVALQVHQGWTVPLQAHSREVAQRTASLEQELQRSLATIREARQLQARVNESNEKLRLLWDGQPAGSPVVWVPQRVQEHFRRFGFTVEIVRVNAVLDEGVPGYKRLYCGFAVPIGNDPGSIGRVLFAVADLEAQNRFIKTIDFGTQPKPEDPTSRTAVMNIVALVRE